MLFLFEIKVFQQLSIFQQQFITIMMSQIPILVNRKGSKGNQLAFKILPLERNVKIAHRRQKTYDSTKKPNFQQRKHDTLDPTKEKGQHRYRRISSSGGTSKFPKDFFKDILPSTPIKIRFSRSKKDANSESETFSKLNLEQKDVSSCRKDTKQYRIDSPQITCQLANQVQTPKFNNKIIVQDQLCEQKSKTTNRKVKIQEYLTYKKENFPRFFKNPTNHHFQQDQNAQPKLLEQSCLKNIQGTPNETLLQTLGKNPNILRQTLNQYKPFSLKTKLPLTQKQNCQKSALMHRKCDKNVRNFLSTKGLNWKVVQKISGLKFKTKQSKDRGSVSSSQTKTKLPTGLVKGARQDIQELQGNMFRIRKFA